MQQIVFAVTPDGEYRQHAALGGIETAQLRMGRIHEADVVAQQVLQKTLRFFAAGAQQAVLAKVAEYRAACGVFEFRALVAEMGNDAIIDMGVLAA